MTYVNWLIMTAVRCLLFFHLYATVSCSSPLLKMAMLILYTDVLHPECVTKAPSLIHIVFTTLRTVFLQVTGQTEVLAAALVIPFLLMAAASSILCSYISERTGWARPLFITALIILPIGEGLMSTLNEKSSIGKIVGYSLICGLGFGGVRLVLFHYSLSLTQFNNHHRELNYL